MLTIGNEEALHRAQVEPCDLALFILHFANKCLLDFFFIFHSESRTNSVGTPLLSGKTMQDAENKVKCIDLNILEKQ